MEIKVSMNDRFINRTMVAQVLTTAINNSPKSQKQIALEVGLENANAVTMFKQGASKMPIERAAKFADVLGIKKAEFVMLVITEDHNEVLTALSSCFNISERT